MDLDALFAAAIAGDAAARNKLKKKVDSSVDSYTGYTILHSESHKGNAEHVRFILREFANKNLLVKLSRVGKNALYLAAQYWCTEVAEVLIDAARSLLSSSANTHNSVTSFQAFLRQADRNSNTALHAAVARGYFDIVKLLSEADPSDQHSQNNKGKTPIYIAAEEGYTEIVKVLCTTCTAPSFDGPGGSTALHAAIKNLDHNTEVVEVLIGAVRLLSSSSTRSFQDFLRQGDHKDGNTALHAAVERGYFDIVKLLLEADPSDQHSKNYYGETPIYIAAEKGYTEIVKVLCSTCTSPSFDGPCGSTALHAAIKNLDHSTEMVEVLIGAARLLSSFSFQAFLRKSDEDLNTALHKAVMQGNLAIAKLLSEADPGDQHAQNNEGKTPIYIASEKGYTEIVKVLCTTCDPSDQHAQNNEGKTPIYIAAEKGYTEIAKVLCTTCTATSFDGPGGSTALHAAIKNLDHCTEVVEVLIGAVRLLSSSSSRSFQDFLRQGDHKDGNTALHIAVIRGNMAVVKLLLEADSTDNPIQNKKGETPIYIAIEKGYTEIVKLICTTCTIPSGLTAVPYGTALHAAIKNFEERIEVFEVLIAGARLLSSSSSSYSFQDFLGHGDEDSNTVIHIAVIEGNVALVKLLLEADPSYRYLQNNEGKTPMYIAAEKGYNEIVKVICTTCTDPSLDGPGDSTALHPAILNINEDLIWMMLNIVEREYVRKGEIGVQESFENFFNKTDEYGRMILELAVERNYIDLVRHILVKDPAYQRGRGRGCKFVGLMPLIYKASDRDYGDIVILLTETYQAGARTTSSASHKAVIDLISAIKKRQRESVLSMVGNPKHNVVLFNDNLGWTLLHHAAYHQFDSVLSAIVEAQCKLGCQHDYGCMVSTPFHVAAEKGFTSTVILLLKIWPYQSSAYIAMNKEGQNILHLAALQSKKKMIKGILEYCPQQYLKEMVNEKDKYGNTPFHLLIQKGCFVPEFIKYKDLDMMAKNLAEWTPLDNFYIEAEIIAEQAQIRIALDNIQTDRNWKFWRKSIKRELNYIDSVVIPSAREEKDAKFNKARMNLIDEKQGRMKKDLERYKKRTNTQIVVTALITTVTFTVGFTMPGGLYQSGVADQGLVIFSKKTAFNAFMVSDALALLLSTCSLFLYFLESMYEDPRQVSKLNAASTGLNIVSVIAMMLTFITGTYVVLSHSQALAISVCLIGSFFFLFVIVLLIKLVYDRRVERKEE